MKNKRIGFYGVVAVLVLVTTLLFILIFSPGVSSSVLNSIPTDPPDTGSTPGNSEALNNPDYSKLDINTSNVQSVIAAMARPTDYYHETLSTLYYSGGSKTYPRKKWVHGFLERVDVISEDNTVTMHILYYSQDVYMWRPGSSRYYSTSKGEFSADTDQMMMVYQDVLELEPEQIINAGYTVYNSVPCIYVEAKNPLTDYLSKYWIAADTGLLAFGQTLNSDGSVIYTVEAKRTLISPQDEALFLLPDGSSVVQ